MKKLLLSALSLLLTFSAVSQEKIVSFDYQNNIFNNRQELPENEYFTIQGTMPDNVNIVQVFIYKNRKSGKALYNYTWRRPLGNLSESFNIPVTYKLRHNSEYDFEINYYSPVSNQGKQALKESIEDKLTAYLSAAFDVTNKKISLETNVNKMIKEMNQIVETTLTYYESSLPGEFTGFSDIVKNLLKSANNTKMKQVYFEFDPLAHTGNEWSKYSKNIEQEIIEAALSEIEPYLERQMNTLLDQRLVIQHPTEKSFNTIAVNAGYGATYLSGNFDNLDYDRGSFLFGLSFPLGNYNRNKFLGNSSISVGVFLNNFETADGVSLTGPIFNRPYFIGYGYKFLHIFRAQVGAVALSAQNNQDLRTSEIMIRPFVGVSAEINLWLGFDRKRK